jgi:integrase
MNVRDVVLPEGKNDDLMFSDRLIATGLFKPGTHLPKGFCLRVRRSRRGDLIRNWIVQYRSKGRLRRLIIGQHTMTPSRALKKAEQVRGNVLEGKDPQGEKVERREKDTVTLRSIITQFLEYKKTTNMKAGSLWILEHYLLGPCGSRAKAQGMKPHLHGLHNTAADQITQKDVAARLLHVAKHHGTQTAIGLRSALSGMFSWAMTMGLLDANPVIGAFRPEKPEARDRVLDDSELRAIWKGVDEFDHGRVVRLLMLTACRRSEIAGMRWSEFDDPTTPTTWTLPKERSKTGKPHTLPITPLMAEIIKSIPHRNGVDFLFGKGGFTIWSERKEALDERLNLPAWTYHDIRRSVATGMSKLGVQPHVIEAALNHQSGSKAGVAGIYNRNHYEREVRDAMLRWSDHINTLIKGGKPKIVPFKTKSA